MSIFDSFLTKGTNNTMVAQTYETTEVNDICFPISQVPLYWNKGGVGSTIPDEFTESGYMGVLDVLNNTILYSGKEYTVVKNADIIEALAPAFEAGYSTVKVRNFGNTRFHIELENTNITSVIKLGEKEFPVHARIRINNSYDGSLSFGIMIGCWIQVCGNGAILGNALSTKRKHSGMLADEIAGYIESGVSSLSDTTLTQNLSKLNKYWTVPDTELKGMFRGLVEGIPDPKNGIHPIKQALISQSTKENAFYNNNAFALFMAATNMVTYPSNYSIPPSYISTLERNIGKVFK